MVPLYNACSKKQLRKKFLNKYSKRDIENTLADFDKVAQKSKPIKYKKSNITYKCLHNALDAIKIYITDSCNLNCKYCFLPDQLKRKHMGNMTEAVAQQVIDFTLKHISLKEISITFCGGEPLLNYKTLKLIIDACETNAKKNKRKFYYSLTTNGTLLCQEIINYFTKNKVNLTISLDGNKTAHDASRKFSNGKGSHEHIINMLNKLQLSNKRYFKKYVSFITVITPQNPNYLDRYKYFNNLGITNVDYDLVAETSDFKLSDKEKKTINANRNQFDTFLAHEIILGNFKKINYEMPYSKVIEQIMFPQKAILPCSVGIDVIAIDVDGTIYPCAPFVGNLNFSIGHITEGVDFNKTFSFYNKQNIVTKKCYNCWALHFCPSWLCLYALSKENNGLKKPSEKECRSIRDWALRGLKFYIKTHRQNPKSFINWSKHIEL
ncbi:MAG: radical SAM protein [Deltaproteobacteria bacterium]|nr:radical SAM protein [Deltaproteobacteria bacterium]